MTLPTERYQALVRSEKFLRELFEDGAKYSKEEIQDRAYSCLRHYPWTMHLEDLAEACPDILENK